MISLMILVRRAMADVVWGRFFFFWKRLNLLLPFPLPHRATRKGLVYELLLWFMLYCSECLCFIIASNFLCICMNYYFGLFRNLSPSPHIQFQKSIKRKFSNKFTNPLVPTSNFRIASNVNSVINSLIPLFLTRGPSHVLAHTWPTNQNTYVGQWSSLNGNLTAGPRFSLSEIKIY